MAAIDFKNKETLAEFIRLCVLATGEMSPEPCIYIIAAMPAPLGVGDTPAFMVTSNLDGTNSDMFHVMTLLYRKLEDHLKRLERMN